MALFMGLLCIYIRKEGEINVKEGILREEEVKGTVRKGRERREWIRHIIGEGSQGRLDPGKKCPSPPSNAILLSTCTETYNKYHK